jgi:hypothetical protein
MLARFRPSPAMGVALCALVVALGGSAYAVTTFVGTGGKIHACVGANGQLALVKPDVSCRAGESRIAWNQQGPRGLVGARGLPGPTFAAAHSGIDTSTPPQYPDESSSTAASTGRSFTFVLPSAGKLYVRFFSPYLGRNCSSGTAFAGIYLDGTPVPQSAHDLNIPASQIAAEFVGVTPATEAGTHVVEVREDCPHGRLITPENNTDAFAPTWTVMLVGG